MKEFLLFTLLFWGSLGLRAQVLFDTYSYDFGTIDELAGPVSHTFKFRNQGKEPFVVVMVTASCGCTVSEYEMKPIEEGTESEFKVVFDPKDQRGRFEKYVYINSNLDEVITLTMKGSVKPRPRTMDDDFPYILSSGVRLNTLSVNVENAHVGLGIMRAVGVANISTAVSAVVEVEPVEGNEDWLRVEPTRQLVAPLARQEVVLTMRSLRFGIRRGELYVSVNGERQAEKIWVSVVFTRDFSGMSSAEIRDGAKATLSKFFYHFSEQKQGAKLSYDVEIKNSGASELVIDHLESSSAEVKFEVAKKVLRQGEKTVLKVDFTPTQSGVRSETVRIITNDPQNPVREFRVMAKIVN